jgi:hypothetical protein
LGIPGEAVAACGIILNIIRKAVRQISKKVKIVDALLEIDVFIALTPGY